MLNIMLVLRGKEVMMQIHFEMMWNSFAIFDDSSPDAPVNNNKHA